MSRRLQGQPPAFDPGWWRDEAACAGMDGDLFFPTKGHTAEEAKEVCAGCPVILECREYAITTGQGWGIWGGLNRAELDQLRWRRQRAS